MTYFLLPKNNNIIKINLTYNKMLPKMNTSLYNYYNESKKEIDELIKSNTVFDILYDYESLKQIVNTHEYIYSSIPGLKLPISKLKTKTKTFYNLLEINSAFSIFNNENKNKLNILNISNNYQDFNYYIDTIYAGNKTVILSKSDIDNETYKTIKNNMYDIFFFEYNFEDNSKYCINAIIKSLLIIFNNLSNNGTCIINIGNLFYCPTIEFLYLLSNLFENVYLIKPTTTNNLTFEKFIVCKNFIIDNSKIEIYKNNYKEILNYFNSLFELHSLYNENKIFSIINKKIPSYFMNKIYDSNIVFGQNQLETMEQIKNILKSRNTDKLELLKKNNIQKSILWCEKYNIPHNKFIESTNIFLSINKDPEIYI